MSIYYVYAYLSENGSPYYVGKGKGKRAYHKRSKVPVPNNKSLIVFLESELSENKALEIEKLYIKKYGRIDLGTGTLLNKTAGGQGLSGHKFSAETIERMRINNTGKGNPMWRRCAKNHPRFKVPHTAETKRKQSEASKRMWALRKKAMTAT